MGQDGDRFKRGIALAGWLTFCLRRGKTTFRKSELAKIDNLAELQEAKKLTHALEDLAEFGIEVEYQHSVNDAEVGGEQGAYLIKQTALSAKERQALVKIAAFVAFRDWEAAQHDMVPGAFLPDGGSTVLLHSEPFLDLLAEAIHSKQPLRLLYESTTGLSWRETQPLHIAYRKGSWHVLLVDVEKREIRNYRIDKIRKVQNSDRDWDPAWDDEDLVPLVDQLANPFFYGDEPIGEIELAAEDGALVWRYLPDATKTGVTSDGRTIWGFEASNIDHVIDRVVNLHARAEILSPPWVRDRMIDYLEAMVRS